METYYNYLNVEIDSHTDDRQPNMTAKQDFYKIYSPIKFRLSSDQERIFTWI